MKTKTSMVKEYVKSGYYKQALAICSSWNHSISKQESDTLRRAYECYNYPEFYRQLKFDPEEEINKAITILNKLYL